MPVGCFIARIRTPHTTRRLSVEVTTTITNRTRGPGAGVMGMSREKERYLLLGSYSLSLYPRFYPCFKTQLKC